MIRVLLMNRPLAVVEGGTARTSELCRFAEDNLGGAVTDVGKAAPNRPPLPRSAAGLALLLRTVWRMPERVLMLLYPGFPALGVYYLAEHPTLRRRVVCALAYARAFAALLLIRLACRMRKRPIVVDASDLPSQELHRPERGRTSSATLTRLYERLLFRSATAVWIVSPPQGELLASLYGLDRATLVLAQNGNIRDGTTADGPMRSGEGDAGARLVYVGSLNRDQQQLDAAVAAFTQLECPEARFLIAGADGEWLSARADEDPRIVRLGPLSPRACNELVHSCDIGVLVYFRDEPLYDVSHPVKLSLYVTNGVAILSGDSPHIADFIRSHDVGIAADPADLPAAMRTLVGDARLRARFGRNARGMAEGLFWDTVFSRAWEQTRRIVFGPSGSGSSGNRA